MTSKKQWDVFEWMTCNGQALGSIRLHVASNLLHLINDKDFASVAWAVLATIFGTSSVPIIFGDFRKVISFKLSGNKDLQLEIHELADLFQRLTVTKVNIPKFVKAMMFFPSI